MKFNKLFDFGNILHTFPGGVHPDTKKSWTNHKPIFDLDAPDVLVFPMSQHLGAPALPCVDVGDEVFVGQKIGEAQGFMSANVHSSVSGKVLSIEPKLHPNGDMVQSVVIENDRLYTNDPKMKSVDYEKLTIDELVDVIKEAGIVGMGGATFPTHVKVAPAPDKKIEYIIINGAECEPHLSSDHRAMLETPEEIIGGLKILMKIFGIKKGYIAIEKNKPDAIELMREYAKKEEDCEIVVVPLKVKYPQGSEKHLVYAITNIRIPKGKLPKDVGASVHNIDSCAAIHRAVNGMPLIKRIVTIDGDCIKNPSNFRVRIGTPISYLLEKAGGLTKEPKKVVMGGPMMGVSLFDVDVPVIKATSGVLALRDDVPSLIDSEACLRCGKCVKACPMFLLPNVLKIAAKNDDFEALEKLGVSECVECGSCSYICPAGQHPVQYIKIAKIKMRNKKA